MHWGGNEIPVEIAKVPQNRPHARKVQRIQLRKHVLTQTRGNNTWSGKYVEIPLRAHAQAAAQAHAAKDEIAKKAGTAAKSPRPCCA
mmetsp:Transcript_6869/g.12833  ORF Transcript_6869/g.12833 Transcript_6869/m.12833 type:complete len:87 (+) Transcript_6869:1086-1346(+)